MKMIERKDKNEKRRLVIQKQNDRKEINKARYGAEGGSALVMAKTTEFNRRIIAAVLALVFVITTLVGVNFLVRADNDPFNMQTVTENGITVSKGLRNNGNGTYDVKIEASTAAKTNTEEMDTDTPLDIVMVLEQSGSMSQQDVLRRYDALDVSQFSISDAAGKYFKDGDEYYPLEVDTNVYVPAEDGNGETIASWRAQEAEDWKSSFNKDLYYKDGSSYELILASKENWYKNYAGPDDIRIYDIADGLSTLGGDYGEPTRMRNDARTKYGNKVNGSGVYVYKNDMWHLLYVVSKTSVRWDYPTTLFYYTNSTEGSTIRNSSTWNSNKNNPNVLTIIDSEDYYGWAIGDVNTGSGKKNYTNGDLYFNQGTSSKYNYLFTDNRVLAVQAPDSEESNIYEDSLYTKGYQLYYMKNGTKVPIGNPVFAENYSAYDGTLYEANLISRQEAQQEAAANFAQQIAERAAETGADHRVAVVGYASDGNILTGGGVTKDALVSINDNDNNENGVNDDVDYAINNLTASGGNNLPDGLNSAVSIYAANEIDINERKRIVIVFKDDTELDTNAQNTALAAAAKLKDTYSASVYTVGLYNDEPNTTEVNFMSRLSSEWFGTDTNPIVYTQNTDGNTYYYKATDVKYSPSDLDILNQAFTSIATDTQTPTTTLSWTENTVLKDIVSDYFILPANPDTHVLVQSIRGDQTTNNPTGVTYAWGSSEEDSHTLNVTGFDFQGRVDEKLVVTIKDLILKKGISTTDFDENGFMKFPSNTPDSGMYKKADFEKATTEFPIPYALVDPDATEKNGMVLSKKISVNNQASYDLNLQAYSTGQSFNQQIPTDYVLVVDQSGSMTTRDIPTGYSSTGTTKNWKVSDGGANQAYYYKETDSNGIDHYYRVYQKRGDMFEYHAKDTKYVGNMVNNIGWFQRETVQDLGVASQYYYNPSLDDSGSREGSASDNHFYPIRISSQGGLLEYWIRFQFDDVNGTNHKLHYPDQPYYRSPTGGLFGPGDWFLLVNYATANAAAKGLTFGDSTCYTMATFAGVSSGMYVRQVLFTRHADYSQLAYKDDNGVEHLLIDATYCDSNGRPLGGECGENGVPSGDHTSNAEAYWHGTLYTANANITRLEALKNALSDFTDTVANQGVDHRVAIAGFADSGAANTELLTGINLNTSASNKNGVRYANISNAQYSEALLDVSDPAQLQKLRNAIAALDANGGTEGQYGINMAKNILDKRAVTTFTPEGGGNPVDRLKIIVYFTDGTPGNYEYDNQYSYGNEVVNSVSKIKQSPTLYDTEIYSIGTFGFADSDPLVYQKYYDNANEIEYTYDPDYVKTIDGSWGSRYMYRTWLRNTDGYGDTATDTVSDYMRTITSEYPNAAQFVDASWYGTGTKSDNGVYTSMVNRVRGTSTNERYYFLCTDLTGLSRVFRTIASESSLSNADLDENTIFRDTIDGSKFDYSEATVTASTRVIDVDGVDHGAGSGTPIIKTWPNGRQISDDGIVEITGIDYSGTYPTADRDGEKLVVTISGIVPKQTVVGDEVHSNTDNSGVYTPANPSEDIAERQVAPFAKPYITRHSYTTDVGNYKPEATVAITTKIVNEDGSDVSAGDSALDKVVLIAPNGARTLYSGPQTFDGIGNTLPSFYYENIPEGYKVQTSVVTSDTEYTYYLHYDDEDVSQKRILMVGEGENNNFTFANHQLHITSIANTKPVILKETVTGKYSNTEDKFIPVVYLLPPEGISVPNSKTYGDYEWVRDGDNNRMTTTLDAIKGDNSESIELEVPTGWQLVVSNAENERYDTISFTVDDNEPVSGTSYTHSILEDAEETTIVITNEARNIPITGIANSSNHNWIIYILAAIGGLAAIGAGIFLWKKKDVFNEE